MAKTARPQYFEPGIFGVSYAQNQSAVPMAQAALPDVRTPQSVQPMTKAERARAKARGVPGTSSWSRGRSIGVAGPSVTQDLYMAGVRGRRIPVKTRPSGTGINMWEGQKMSIQLPGAVNVSSIGEDAFAAAMAAESAGPSSSSGMASFGPSASAVQAAISMPDPRFEAHAYAGLEGEGEVEASSMLTQATDAIKAHPYISAGVALVLAKWLRLF